MIRSPFLHLGVAAVLVSSLAACNSSGGSQYQGKQDAGSADKSAADQTTQGNGQAGGAASAKKGGNLALTLPFLANATAGSTAVLALIPSCAQGAGNAAQAGGFGGAGSALPAPQPGQAFNWNALLAHHLHLNQNQHQNACAMISQTVAYQPGVQIVLDQVPVGNATVAVAVFDQNGTLIEIGQSPVTVNPGQQAAANVTISPVGGASDTGSVAVTITEANGALPGQGTPIFSTPTFTSTAVFGSAPTIGSTSTAVSALAGSRLAFVGLAASQAINACSPVGVTIEDVNGQPAAAPSATTLLMATNSPTGAFFSDANCTAQVASASIAAGASSLVVSAYYKDSAAGVKVLSVTDTAGVLSPASSDILVTTTP